MKYDTIIFDLDGTLLNTLTDLKNALNYALDKYSFPTLSLDEVRLKVGNGIKNLVSLSLNTGINNPNYNQVFEAFCDYYKNHCTIDTTIYPEISELITSLKQKHLKLAIISNKANDLVNKIVNFYFNDTFDFYLGATSSLKKKPSSEMIDYAISKLNTSREKVLYIGDSEVDYESAINTNIDYLIATWGFRTKKELINSKVNNFINSPSEILNYL